MFISKFKKCAVLSVILLGFTTLGFSQGSIVGKHATNLKLKNISAEKVIKILSERSKSANAFDDGRYWKVVGAEKLRKYIINVDFSRTPIPQILTETLGCLGYSFTEGKNSIKIVSLDYPFEPDQCKNIELLSKKESLLTVYGIQEVSSKRNCSEIQVL